MSELKKICLNCEFFDIGSFMSKPASNGDCHNSLSPRFTPEIDFSCNQFYPVRPASGAAITHQEPNFMIKINESTLKKIKLLDEKLNRDQGFEANDIIFSLSKLFQFGCVEVGWREACGTTDRTHKIYREWLKVIKLIRKDGININEERVKHANSYATGKGGFWSSVIYILENKANVVDKN